MMTDTRSPPLDDPLNWAQQMLSAAAVAVNLEVSDGSDLASSVFKGGEHAPAARLDSADLPTSVRGLRLGRYAVLVGLMPEQPSTKAVTEALRRYRNQCVIARSYLTPNEALDLHLILVGPRGSERQDEWQPLALVVERDDRVARKLAWLRPKEPDADKASFAEFLKRTFLARPWKSKAVFTMAALDNLHRVARVGDVPRDTVDEWIKLALTKRDDPPALVDGLIEAWARRGQV